MEGGTLIGLAIAGMAAALVAVGTVLARWGRASGRRSPVIAFSLGVALITCICGVVIVGAGESVYLDSVPDCSSSESHPTPAGEDCILEGSERGKGAVAAGLLGGLIVGVIGGCGAAWRRSRSLRMVAGGLLAAFGASVLVVESLIVLVLWSA